MSGPPLWVVRADGSEVFVFGQGPWGVREGDDWFADEHHRAFDDCSEYWHEVPDDARLADAELLSRYGLSGPGLLSQLTAEQRSTLNAAAGRVDVEPATLEGLRPWLAGQLLDEALKATSEDRLLDVEAVLTERARAARKVVHAEFRDAEALLATFADLGLAEVDYLMWTAERVAKGAAELRRQADAWLAGDLSVFEAEVSSMHSTWPRLHDRIIRERNDGWVPRIDAMLRRSGTAFVVMGMGHLVGHGGVLELLSAPAIERVC